MYCFMNNFIDNIFRTHLHDLEVIVCHLRSAVKDESGKFKVVKSRLEKYKILFFVLNHNLN